MPAVAPHLPGHHGQLACALHGGGVGRGGGGGLAGCCISASAGRPAWRLLSCVQGRMMAGSGAGAGDTSAGLAAVAWAREAVASGGAVDAAACEAAAVLLGAVGAADVDAPPLAQLLTGHADAGVRQAAVEAVGKLGAPAAAAAIGVERAVIRAMAVDKNGDVRAAAAKAAARLAEAGCYASDRSGEELLGTIVGVFTDRLPRVREAAVRACGRIFAARTRGGRKRQKKKTLSGVESGAAAHIAALLEDTDADVRAEAVVALGKLGSASAAKVAVAVARLLVRSPGTPAVSAALVALNAVPQLEELSAHGSPAVRSAALAALHALEDSDASDEEAEPLAEDGAGLREEQGATAAERIRVAKQRVRPRSSSADWGVARQCWHCQAEGALFPALWKARSTWEEKRGEKTEKRSDSQY